MTRLIIGADPGLYGAVGWSCGDAAGVVDLPTCEAGKTGRRRIDPSSLVLRLRESLPAENPTAYLEDVHSSPQMGVASAFAFGRSFGALEGALAGLGCGLRYVRPATWKRYMSVGASKSESLARARQLYPSLADQLTRAKDDGRAEALLLAWYGAEMEGL